METEKSAQKTPPAESTDAAEAQANTGADETATLLAKLAEKEAEAKTHYDLFMRERAELENFKRRMQREKSESVRFANEPLIRDLLPILDNLERAVSHAQGAGNGQLLVDGVTLVARSFLDTMEKYGVTREEAKGQPFDPSKHEAMAQVEKANVTPNTVDEYCPAYWLHGRLPTSTMTVAKRQQEKLVLKHKKLRIEQLMITSSKDDRS
jgi:molecular chaperone GrpE